MAENCNSDSGVDCAIYAEPGVSRPKLRIGLMLDSLSQPAWKAKVIADLAKAPYLELALVMLNDRPAPEKKSFFAKIKALWPTFLFSLYVKLDNKFHRSPQEDAFQDVDMTSLLENVPLIKVEAIEKKFVDRFSETDVEKVKAAKLDVLLRFGFRIIKGEILNTARFGVWSYHHGDNREYRGTPPLFWEMYERNAISGTVLQILNEQLDGGRVIYRSSSATHFTSLYCNQNPTYWKTAEFIPRRLRELYTFGWEYIERLPTYSESIRYEKPIYKTPRNSQMLVFFYRLAGRVVGAAKRRLRAEQWMLTVQEVGESDATTSGHLLVIRPPRDRFYADPFLFSHQGRDFLFFEEFLHPGGKGVISCLELTEGKPSPPKIVLERAFHLSYPFLFHWGKHVFMMPETKGNSTVELYRAVDFPERWQFDRILLSGVKAVDPTLLEHDGKFWLFVCVTVPRARPSEELFLFFAETPFGPWHAHPMNPVVSDVRNARPAGRILSQDGKLLRPAQDCSLRYGYRIRLNSIEELSETTYRESPCGEIGSNLIENTLATHTVSENDSYRVLDALCSVRKSLWWPFAGNRSASMQTEYVATRVQQTL